MNIGQNKNDDGLSEQLVPFQGIDTSRNYIHLVPENDTTGGSLVGMMSNLPGMSSTFGLLSHIYLAGRESSLPLVRTTLDYGQRWLEPSLRSLDAYAGRALVELAQTVHQRSWPSKMILGQTIECLGIGERCLARLIERMRDRAAQAHIQWDGRLEGWQRNLQEREEEVERRASEFRVRAEEEIGQILKMVVRSIDGVGRLLPLPGQNKLRDFLLTLPQRLGRAKVSAGEANLFILANEAIVIIKSMANIIAFYHPISSDEGLGNDEMEINQSQGISTTTGNLSEL